MSASDTTTGVPYVLIGPPIHENRWNPELEQVEAGYVQKVRWIANSAIIPVFVPDGADFAKTLDARARHQGEQFDAATGG